MYVLIVFFVFLFYLKESLSVRDVYSLNQKVIMNGEVREVLSVVEISPLLKYSAESTSKTFNYAVIVHEMKIRYGRYIQNFLEDEPVLVAYFFMNTHSIVEPNLWFPVDFLDVEVGTVEVIEHLKLLLTSINNTLGQPFEHITGEDSDFSAGKWHTFVNYDLHNFSPDVPYCEASTRIWSEGVNVKYTQRTTFPRQCEENGRIKSIPLPEGMSLDAPKGEYSTTREFRRGIIHKVSSRQMLKFSTSSFSISTKMKKLKQTSEYYDPIPLLYTGKSNNDMEIDGFVALSFVDDVEKFLGANQRRGINYYFSDSELYEFFQETLETAHEKDQSVSNPLSKILSETEDDLGVQMTNFFCRVLSTPPENAPADPAEGAGEGFGDYENVWNERVEIVNAMGKAHTAHTDHCLVFCVISLPDVAADAKNLAFVYVEPTEDNLAQLFSLKFEGFLDDDLLKKLYSNLGGIVGNIGVENSEVAKNVFSHLESELLENHNGRQELAFVGLRAAKIGEVVPVFLNFLEICEEYIQPTLAVLQEFLDDPAVEETVFAYLIHEKSHLRVSAFNALLARGNDHLPVLLAHMEREEIVARSSMKFALKSREMYKSESPAIRKNSKRVNTFNSLFSRRSFDPMDPSQRYDLDWNWEYHYSWRKEYGSSDFNLLFHLHISNDLGMQVNFVDLHFPAVWVKMNNSFECSVTLFGKKITILDLGMVLDFDTRGLVYEFYVDDDSYKRRSLEGTASGDRRTAPQLHEFSMLDATWADVKMVGDKKISEIGALLTCVAMVLRSFVIAGAPLYSMQDVDVDPGSLNVYIREHFAYDIDGEQVNLDALQSLGMMRVESKNIEIGDFFDSYNVIVETVSGGFYVCEGENGDDLQCVDPSKNTGEQATTVSKADDLSEFYVLDMSLQDPSNWDKHSSVWKVLCPHGTTKYGNSYFCVGDIEDSRYVDNHILPDRLYDPTLTCRTGSLSSVGTPEDDSCAMFGFPSVDWGLGQACYDLRLCYADCVELDYSACNILFENELDTNCDVDGDDRDEDCVSVADTMKGLLKSRGEFPFTIFKKRYCACDGVAAYDYQANSLGPADNPDCSKFLDIDYLPKYVKTNLFLFCEMIPEQSQFIYDELMSNHVISADEKSMLLDNCTRFETIISEIASQDPYNQQSVSAIRREIRLLSRTMDLYSWRLKIMLLESYVDYSMREERPCEAPPKKLYSWLSVANYETDPSYTRFLISWFHWCRQKSSVLSLTDRIWLKALVMKRYCQPWATCSFEEGSSPPSSKKQKNKDEKIFTHWYPMFEYFEVDASLFDALRCLPGAVKSLQDAYKNDESPDFSCDGMGGITKSIDLRTKPGKVKDVPLLDSIDFQIFSYTYTYGIPGIFGIELSVGLDLLMGMDAAIGFDLFDFRLWGDVIKPWMAVAVNFEAGVNFGIIRGGIVGDITLLKQSIALNGEARFDSMQFDLSLVFTTDLFNVIFYAYYQWRKIEWECASEWICWPVGLGWHDQNRIDLGGVKGLQFEFEIPILEMIDEEYNSISEPDDVLEPIVFFENDMQKTVQLSAFDPDGDNLALLILMEDNLMGDSFLWSVDVEELDPYKGTLQVSPFPWIGGCFQLNFRSQDAELVSEQYANAEIIVIPVAQAPMLQVGCVPETCTTFEDVFIQVNIEANLIDRSGSEKLSVMIYDLSDQFVVRKKSDGTIINFSTDENAHVLKLKNENINEKDFSIEIEIKPPKNSTKSFNFKVDATSYEKIGYYGCVEKIYTGHENRQTATSLKTKSIDVIPVNDPIELFWDEHDFTKIEELGEIGLRAYLKDVDLLPDQFIVCWIEAMERKGKILLDASSFIADPGSRLGYNLMFYGTFADVSETLREIRYMAWYDQSTGYGEYGDETISLECCDGAHSGAIPSGNMPDTTRIQSYYEDHIDPGVMDPNNVLLTYGFCDKKELSFYIGEVDELPQFLEVPGVGNADGGNRVFGPVTFVDDKDGYHLSLTVRANPSLGKVRIESLPPGWESSDGGELVEEAVISRTNNPPSSTPYQRFDSVSVMIEYSVDPGTKICAHPVELELNDQGGHDFLVMAKVFSEYQYFDNRRAILGNEKVEAELVIKRGWLPTGAHTTPDGVPRESTAAACWNVKQKRNQNGQYLSADCNRGRLTSLGGYFGSETDRADAPYHDQLLYEYGRSYACDAKIDIPLPAGHKTRGLDYFGCHTSLSCNGGNYETLGRCTNSKCPCNTPFTRPGSSPGSFPQALEVNPSSMNDLGASDKKFHCTEWAADSRERGCREDYMKCWPGSPQLMGSGWVRPKTQSEYRGSEVETDIRLNMVSGDGEENKTFKRSAGHSDFTFGTTYMSFDELHLAPTLSVDKEYYRARVRMGYPGGYTDYSDKIYVIDEPNFRLTSSKSLISDTDHKSNAVEEDSSRIYLFDMRSQSNYLMTHESRLSDSSVPVVVEFVASLGSMSKSKCGPGTWSSVKVCLRDDVYWTPPSNLDGQLANVIKYRMYVDEDHFTRSTAWRYITINLESTHDTTLLTLPADLIVIATENVPEHISGASVVDVDEIEKYLVSGASISTHFNKYKLVVTPQYGKVRAFGGSCGVSLGGQTADCYSSTFVEELVCTKQDSGANWLKYDTLQDLISNCIYYEFDERPDGNGEFTYDASPGECKARITFTVTDYFNEHDYVDSTIIRLNTAPKDNPILQGPDVVEIYEDAPTGEFLSITFTDLDGDFSCENGARVVGEDVTYAISFSSSLPNGELRTISECSGTYGQSGDCSGKSYDVMKNIVENLEYRFVGEAEETCICDVSVTVTSNSPVQNQDVVKEIEIHLVSVGDDSNLIWEHELPTGDGYLSVLENEANNVGLVFLDNDRAKMCRKGSTTPELIKYDIRYWTLLGEYGLLATNSDCDENFKSDVRCENLEYDTLVDVLASMEYKFVGEKPCLDEIYIDISSNTIPEDSPLRKDYTVVITRVNDPPIFSYDDTHFDVLEGSILQLNGISVDDADMFSGVGELTISVVNSGGTVRSTNTNLVMFISDDPDLKVRGTLESVNDFLSGLEFVPDEGFYSIDDVEVTLTFSDLGRTADDGVTQESVLDLFIQVINDPEVPILIGPSTYSAIEDVSGNIPGINVFDPDRLDFVSVMFECGKCQFAVDLLVAGCTITNPDGGNEGTFYPRMLELNCAKSNVRDTLSKISYKADKLEKGDDTITITPETTSGQGSPHDIAVFIWPIVYDASLSFDPTLPVERSYDSQKIDFTFGFDCDDPSQLHEVEIYNAWDEIEFLGGTPLSGDGRSRVYQQPSIIQIQVKPLAGGVFDVPVRVITTEPLTSEVKTSPWDTLNVDINLATVLQPRFSVPKSSPTTYFGFENTRLRIEKGITVLQFDFTENSLISCDLSVEFLNNRFPSTGSAKFMRLRSHQFPTTLSRNTANDALNLIEVTPPTHFFGKGILTLSCSTTGGTSNSQDINLFFKGVYTATLINLDGVLKNHPSPRRLLQARRELDLSAYDYIMEGAGHENYLEIELNLEDFDDNDDLTLFIQVDGGLVRMMEGEELFEDNDEYRNHVIKGPSCFSEFLKGFESLKIRADFDDVDSLTLRYQPYNRTWGEQRLIVTVSTRGGGESKNMKYIWVIRSNLLPLLAVSDRVYATEGNFNSSLGASNETSNLIMTELKILDDDPIDVGTQTHMEVMYSHFEGELVLQTLSGVKLIEIYEMEGAQQKVIHLIGRANALEAALAEFRFVTVPDFFNGTCVQFIYYELVESGDTSGAESELCIYYANVIDDPIVEVGLLTIGVQAYPSLSNFPPELLHAEDRDKGLYDMTLSIVVISGELYLDGDAVGSSYEFVGELDLIVPEFFSKMQYQASQGLFEDILEISISNDEGFSFIENVAILIESEGFVSLQQSPLQHPGYVVVLENVAIDILSSLVSAYDADDLNALLPIGESVRVLVECSGENLSGDLELLGQSDISDMELFLSSVSYVSSEIGEKNTMSIRVVSSSNEVYVFSFVFETTFVVGIPVFHFDDEVLDISEDDHEDLDFWIEWNDNGDKVLGQDEGHFISVSGIPNEFVVSSKFMMFLCVAEPDSSCDDIIFRYSDDPDFYIRVFPPRFCEGVYDIDLVALSKNKEAAEGISLVHTQTIHVYPIPNEVIIRVSDQRVVETTTQILMDLSLEIEDPQETVFALWYECDYGEIVGYSYDSDNDRYLINGYNWQTDSAITFVKTDLRIIGDFNLTIFVESGETYLDTDYTRITEKEVVITVTPSHAEIDFNLISEETIIRYEHEIPVVEFNLGFVDPSILDEGIVCEISDLSDIYSINDIEVTESTHSCYDFTDPEDYSIDKVHSFSIKKQVKFYGGIQLKFEYYSYELELGNSPVASTTTELFFLQVYDWSFVQETRPLVTSGNHKAPVSLDLINPDSDDMLGYELVLTFQPEGDIHLTSYFGDVFVEAFDGEVIEFTGTPLDVKIFMNNMIFECVGTNYLENVIHITVDDGGESGEDVANLGTTVNLQDVYTWCDPENHLAIIENTGLWTVDEKFHTSEENFVSVGLQLTELDKEEFSSYSVTLHSENQLSWFRDAISLEVWPNLFQVNGTLDDVNLALWNLEIGPGTLYFNGVDTIHMILYDFGHEKIGSTIKASYFFDLVVNPKNSPPFILGVEDGREVIIDYPLMAGLSFVSLSDVDAGDNDIQFTLQCGECHFEASCVNLVERDEPNEMELKGSVGDLNLCMDGISYWPGEGLNGGSEIVTLTVNDLGHSEGGVPGTPYIDVKTINTIVTYRDLIPQWTFSSDRTWIELIGHRDGPAPTQTYSGLQIHVPDIIEDVEIVDLIITIEGGISVSSACVSCEPTQGSGEIRFSAKLEKMNEFLSSLSFEPGSTGGLHNVNFDASVLQEEWDLRSESTTYIIPTVVEFFEDISVLETMSLSDTQTVNLIFNEVDISSLTDLIPHDYRVTLSCTGCGFHYDSNFWNSSFVHECSRGDLYQLLSSDIMLGSSVENLNGNIMVSVSIQDVTDGLSMFSGLIGLSVLPVNSAPKILIPSNVQIVRPLSMPVLSGVTVWDDDDGGLMSMTIQCPDGQFLIDESVFPTVQVSDTELVFDNFVRDDLNTALKTIEYLPQFPGNHDTFSRMILISVCDNGNVGIGQIETTEEYLTVDVDPRDLRPYWDSPGGNSASFVMDESTRVDLGVVQVRTVSAMQAGEPMWIRVEYMGGNIQWNDDCGVSVVDSGDLSKTPAVDQFLPDFSLSFMVLEGSLLEMNCFLNSLEFAPTPYYFSNDDFEDRFYVQLKSWTEQPEWNKRWETHEDFIFDIEVISVADAPFVFCPTEDQDLEIEQGVQHLLKFLPHVVDPFETLRMEAVGPFNDKAYLDNTNLFDRMSMEKLDDIPFRAYFHGPFSFDIFVFSVNYEGKETSTVCHVNVNLLQVGLFDLEYEFFNLGGSGGNSNGFSWSGQRPKIPKRLGWNKGGDQTDDDGDRRKVEEISHSFPVKFCSTSQWDFHIDNNNELFVKGNPSGNDYVNLDDTESFVKVDFSNEVYSKDWKPADSPLIQKGEKKWIIASSGLPVVPKKILCTRSSAYLLTENDWLYVMGLNTHHEIDGNAPLSSFHKTLEQVSDVYASYHTVYVVSKTAVSVPFCENFDLSDNCVDVTVPTVEVQRVMVIGSNEFNSLCIGSSHGSSKGRYYDIWFDFVSSGVSRDLSSTQISDLSPPGPYDVYSGAFEFVNPKVQAFEHGALLTYYLFDEFVPHHYFCGRDHPSFAYDTDRFERVYFRDNIESQLVEDVFIDYVDRIYGGMLYIISSERIYMSGRILEESCVDCGMAPFDNVRVPVEISPRQYGEYRHERIYSFSCSFACYIQCEGSLYMFGKAYDGIGLGASCENDHCGSIGKSSEIYSGAIPYSSNTVVEEEMLKIRYFVVPIERTTPFNTLSDVESYRYPPEIWHGSGMEANNLTLILRKPLVFQQMTTLLYFVEWDEDENEYAKRSGGNIGYCMYPYSTDEVRSEWKLSYDTEETVSEFFTLNLSWEFIVSNCLWDHNNHEKFGADLQYYDIYSTRLAMEERFFRGIQYGSAVSRTEIYYWDLEVRFPKEVLKTEITVMQDEFSEMWSFYVLDKSFDRASREGEIQFVVLCRSPNFFVFSDIAAANRESIYSSPLNTFKERIGDLEKSVLNYYKIDSISVSEIDIKEETNPFSQPKNVATNSFQTFSLKFALQQDHRICTVPETHFLVNFVQFCDIAKMGPEYSNYHAKAGTEDSSDCVQPSREISLELITQVDDLCSGEFTSSISVIVDWGLYFDWEYAHEVDEDKHVFGIDDWIYIKADVESLEVSIDFVGIHSISLASQVLYEQTFDDSYERTQNGEACDLVIDELDLDSTYRRAGFHFRTANSVLKMQPSETAILDLDIELRILYTGNNFETHADRRQKMHTVDESNSKVIGLSFHQETVSLYLRNDIETRNFNSLPYLISVAVVAVVSVVCVLGLSLIGLLAKRELLLDRKK